MRDANWASMALDLNNATTVTAAYEVAPNLDKNAAPETEAGLWTHFTANFVRDYICPNWTARFTCEGEVTDRSDRGSGSKLSP